MILDRTDFIDMGALPRDYVMIVLFLTALYVSHSFLCWLK